ncbi:PCI domain-containing protein 2 [Lamellibrachia satsuma]|nr:PCI domain-containing protein 2 [Lamellibrachia satsuma]
MLSLRHPHVASRHLQLKKPESQCERWFTAPWDEMVAAHLRCCWAIADGNFVEAYCCQAVVVQVYTRILQSQKDENWGLPILFTMTLDLRLLANRADLQLRRTGQGKTGDTLEKAAEVLMYCFRACASDSRASVEFSKKWGMLNLVNHLFKIYFKISKMHLCKPLIRAIDSLPIRDKFSLSQRVTYKALVGEDILADIPSFGVLCIVTFNVGILAIPLQCPTPVLRWLRRCQVGHGSLAPCSNDSFG